MTTGRKKCTYSDERKAEALAVLDANGGNGKRTSRQLGIPESTLKGWARGRGAGGVGADLRAQKKGELADRLEEIAQQILDATPAKIAAASLQQAMTCLGIAVDKMGLLREHATAISGQADGLGDEERMERFAALFERARHRGEGRPAGAADVAVGAGAGPSQGLTRDGQAPG